jgi:hypothetical protein
MWAALIAMAWRCTSLNQYAGGGGTETVVGMIVNADGSPAAQTTVELLPSDYNPETPGSLGYDVKAMTDNSGIYTIKDVAAGEYTLQAVQLSKRTRALKTGITVAKDNSPAPVDTLHTPGTVVVALPGGIDPAKAYVYIPGTSIAVFSDESGDPVTLDSVPVGIVPEVAYGLKNGAARRAIRYRVTVAPSETTVVKNPAWGYARDLYLNTTASGAQINAAVKHFPVLVRLTRDNFNFAEAKAHGEDLRFRKSDDTPMQYEIEGWDSADSQAEMWVAVDTVYGNDNGHYFLMYWGNPTATNESNGASIFDTANGFQGVWHLAEPGNSTPGGYRDATVNAYNLSGTNRSAASGAEGMIGGAQSFDTIPADSITGPCPAKLNGNASFTASFWVKLIALKPSRPDLLDFGAETYLAGCHFLVWPDFTVQFGMFDTGTFTPPNGPEPQHQNSFSIASYAASWMQITTVYNAAEGTLASYLNGTLIKQKSISAIQLDPKDGLHIGKPYNFAPGGFSGTVDEVRILSVPLSQDWIKLDYENQRKGGMLVRFF